MVFKSDRNAKIEELAVYLQQWAMQDFEILPPFVVPVINGFVESLNSLLDERLTAVLFVTTSWIILYENSTLLVKPENEHGNHR